jgi:hypothetical protein
MRRLAILGALGLAACAADPMHGLTAAQLRDMDIDSGPQPTIETARDMLEAAVKARLRDPQSAQFEWPHGFALSSALSPGAARGWFTCGSVNARNGFGGYSGRKAVMVVVDNGRVTWLDIDNGPYHPVANSCAKSRMPVL